MLFFILASITDGDLRRGEYHLQDHHPPSRWSWVQVQDDPADRLHPPGWPKLRLHASSRLQAAGLGRVAWRRAGLAAFGRRPCDGRRAALRAGLPPPGGRLARDRRFSRRRRPTHRARCGSASAAPAAEPGTTRRSAAGPAARTPVRLRLRQCSTPGTRPRPGSARTPSGLLPRQPWRPWAPWEEPRSNASLVPWHPLPGAGASLIPLAGTLQRHSLASAGPDGDAVCSARSLLTAAPVSHPCPPSGCGPVGTPSAHVRGQCTRPPTRCAPHAPRCPRTPFMPSWGLCSAGSPGRAPAQAASAPAEGGRPGDVDPRLSRSCASAKLTSEPPGCALTAQRDVSSGP